jgi:hypothetical protein
MGAIEQMSGVHTSTLKDLIQLGLVQQLRVLGLACFLCMDDGGGEGRVRVELF